MRITCGAKGFRDWIESHPPGAIVGHAMNYYACPIANYITEQGAHHVEVAQANYIVSFTDPETGRYTHEGRRTPPWAARCIKRLDQIGRARGDYTMTREDVLTVLDAA